jgi:precorrin-6A/cobalt-precorrin-6A reductase
MPKRLLILGGTAEAAALARRAVETFAADVDVVTSLAGRLPDRPDLPGEVRVGGFGGADGLRDYLRSARIDLLVDATHPFAAVISGNAAEACAVAGVPRLMLVRPAWRPEPGDQWQEVDSLAQAAALLPRIARRVFLTTGPGGIEAFTQVVGVWFLVRLFTQPSAPLPLPAHQTLVARPPFTRDGERRVLGEHRIDALVTKNSGGPTETKLTAAREAGVRVIMIRRPKLPAGELVESADTAIAWLRNNLTSLP